MPSFNIHLAVGKRYYEKNSNISDDKEFYKGLIAPDFANDDDQSHYTKIGEKTHTLKEHFENKVQLYEYLKTNPENSDFEKGVFLHLITDYLFFTTFFDIDYVESTSYKEFCDNLYYSYGLTNSYLENKYGLQIDFLKDSIEKNIQTNKKKKQLDDEKKTNIIPTDKLDEFIEKTSNIDLEKYRKEILKQKKNILPF